jgi:TetR/AcrR family transcriptional repressor of nem operon
MPQPSLKEEIVEAALKVFHERGFNAAGVKDVTDAAGAPKGSFYNHFHSKERLGVAALDRYWQRTRTALDILKDEQIPPIARLRASFRTLGEGASRNFKLGCMLGNFSTELSDQSPQIREHLTGIFESWTRAIEACAAAAQRDGSMRQDIDAEVIAAFLVNSWEGAMLRAKVDRTGAAIQAFEEIVFNGLLVR